MATNPCLPIHGEWCLEIALLAPEGLIPKAWFEWPGGTKLNVDALHQPGNFRVSPGFARLTPLICTLDCPSSGIHPDKLLG